MLQRFIGVSVQALSNPMLATLLEERDVGVERRLVGGKWRKIYRLTTKGRRELQDVRKRLALLSRLLAR